jgi:hypothetical protein
MPGAVEGRRKECEGQEGAALTRKKWRGQSSMKMWLWTAWTPTMSWWGDMDMLNSENMLWNVWLAMGRSTSLMKICRTLGEESAAALPPARTTVNCGGGEAR